MTAADTTAMPEAFAALGWPGKTVEQYRGYLDDQAAGRRSVWVASVEGEFAGYVTVTWTSDYGPFRDADDDLVLMMTRHVGERPRRYPQW